MFKIEWPRGTTDRAKRYDNFTEGPLGAWHDVPEIPRRSVMIVASDFDTLCLTRPG